MFRLQKSFVIAALFAASSSLVGCVTAEETHAATDRKIEMATELPKEYVQGQKTLEVAQKFLYAAGSGDGATLSELMTDDFVWHNEGDNRLPWIGNWEGKETVLGTFMPAFGSALETTSWTTDYSMASGDQAIFMGTMSAKAKNTGVDTGKFSWAVRVNVVDGKVKSWNWFEDSFAVSKAYNAENK